MRSSLNILPSTHNLHSFTGCELFYVNLCIFFFIQELHPNCVYFLFGISEINLGLEYWATFLSTGLFGHVPLFVRASDSLLMTAFRTKNRILVTFSNIYLMKIYTEWLPHGRQIKYYPWNCFLFVHQYVFNFNFFFCVFTQSFLLKLTLTSVVINPFLDVMCIYVFYQTCLFQTWTNKQLENITFTNQQTGLYINHDSFYALMNLK